MLDLELNAFQECSELTCCRMWAFSGQDPKIIASSDDSFVSAAPMTDFAHKCIFLEMDDWYFIAFFNVEEWSEFNQKVWKTNWKPQEFLGKVLPNEENHFVSMA